MTLTGVEALVRLLLLRRDLDERDGLTTATMVSGYPGSPLGTFDLALDGLGADVRDENRIVHHPGLNEELALATVWGSQMGTVVPYSAGLDGVAGAWYGKGPGLDRSGDALRHANSLGAGPGGGAVAFCGDDPSAKSSTLTCDSQYTFADACVPVLYPGDQQDVLDLGLHAFRMSRYCGAWTGLKIVTAVADGIGPVELSPDRHAFVVPETTIDGETWRHVPQKTVGPHAVPGQERLVSDLRLRAAQDYARANGIDRVYGPARADLGIVCAGKTYFDVLDALGGDPAAAGVRVLRLGMTFPLAEETVTGFAATVGAIAVIEEKRPFVETQLRALLHEAGAGVPVLGKRKLDLPVDGEIDPRRAAAAITKARPETPVHYSERIVLPLLPQPPLPARPPGYCSGCPHNRSTVVPDGALTGGGVGCHGIQYFEPRQAHHQSLPPPPMGAEGVPWLGLAPFTDEPPGGGKHLIQNLGDGTLSHSGTLAIRAAVAAGADITFKILYNAAVAMTGGQDVTGLLDVPALTRALEAEGVAEVAVCAEDPSRYGRRARWGRGAKVHGRDKLTEVQDDLRAVRGVTVLIYDQRCAAEARRLRKRGELETPPREVVINEAVCEGCGDCGAKSNCLSVLPVMTEFGEKRQIHDPSCNRDYTCLEGDCPSFVTLTPKKRRSRAAARTPVSPSASIPAPADNSNKRGSAIYFTGIGGTGVVTASRIIAGAAEAAGLAVGGLDQTGLSQKAGAVVSHLHLAPSASDLGAATVDTADLYLSGDILQAAAPQHLAKIGPATVVVVDPGITPTAGMLQSGAGAPDPEALAEAIRRRAPGAVFLDAKRVAEAVFGDHLLGNVILAGAAFQLGALPFSAGDVKVSQANRDAFTWGRWMIHDPGAARAAIEEPRGPGPFSPSRKALKTAETIPVPENLPEDLRDLVTRRAAQVADYQDARLAARYAGLVARAAARDDRDWALTRAVAEAWFKLLTYKDEYEVARLHLAADYGPYKVTYHLHPPVLRRLGLRKKLPMSWPYAAAFRVLRAARHVRGTPLDVFGWDADRRLERALIAEYEELIGELPHEAAVKVSEAVLDIKGYAGIKEAAAVTWREEVRRLCA
ncbi:MAG: indolepyruvate ferredoxin oxidoreductase family protein [Streptosporangiales bacterium]|nr:indolepyruvate ferredoxin oxidoreductase family protein [Streptosporangiales bacterium]